MSADVWPRRQLIAIRERVEAEDRAPPSVAELARLCGIGERHLLRLFRAATGETVSGFVRKALTERARRMLSQTDLPTKEIAYRLGFLGRIELHRLVSQDHLRHPGQLSRADPHARLRLNPASPVVGQPPDSLVNSAIKSGWPVWAVTPPSTAMFWPVR